MEELKKILEKYTLSNEMLDKEALLAIINVYLEENNLTSFVNKIEFSNSYDFVAAYYNKQKKLSFNMMKISQSVINYRSYQEIPNINNNSLNQEYNYVILWIIFHEIRHIEQEKYYCNNGGVREKIFDYENLCCDSEHKYNQIYEYLLSERQANVFGMKKALELFSILRTDTITKNQLMLYRLRSINQMLTGYTSISNPLWSLIYNTTNIRDSYNTYYKFVKDILKEKMAFDNRLDFGFPISIGEYYALQKERKVLMKSVNRRM